MSKPPYPLTADNPSIETDERYRTLVERSPDAVYIHRNGHFTFVNPATLKIFGATGAEQLIGKRVMDFVHPDFKDVVLQRMEMSRQNKPSPLMEQKVLRLDGSIVDVEAIGIPFILDGELMSQVILRDITERKLAESAVRRSEEAFRMLFANNPVPMWVYDSSTLQFLEVNAAAVAHYCYTRTEFLQMTVRDIRPPEDLPELLDYIKMEKPPFRPPREWRHMKKNGDIITVFASSHSLDFSGRQAVLVVIQDMTERRKLEEQLRQSQKMDAVGQLAGGVAHDFNNILTVISGHTHLLLMENTLDAPIRDSLSHISTAASRAANLTSQLLAFSRKQMMQPRTLNLNNAIETLTQMLRRIIGEDISLQYTPAANLPPIEGDPGMIEQALLNLVVNARDAMPRGGKLFIETEKVSFHESDLQGRANARAGEFISLRVRDTGAGIPPEILSHIFEPFFTTKGVGKGTGLGLATVYGIVNQHHGWIDVESQTGLGTTFQIFFPAVSQTDFDLGFETPKPEPHGGSEIILLVEDETAVRELARQILEQHGYKIHEAESGAAALKSWKNHADKFDLLLTDLVMPDGVSGRDLAEQLQKQSPKLKVVFTSGYSTDAFETNFFVREKRHFLQKPYDADSLLRTVRDALDK